MTTTLSLPTSESQTQTTATRIPNVLTALVSSPLVYFAPSRIGDLWLRISTAKAAAVAAINLALAPLWLLLISTSASTWMFSTLHLRRDFKQPLVSDPASVYLDVLQSFPVQIFKFASRLKWPTKAAFSVTIVLLLVLALAFTFFVLLPFAARPGKGKPAVKHVIRTVLLATGCIHIWGPLLTLAYLYFAIYNDAGLENIMGPLFLLLSALIIWTFTVLTKAVRKDYRTPADFPEPHDPICDKCGYNLIMAPMNGRCPECGKPVAESLGENVRRPTPWEQNPSPLNTRALLPQLRQLITRPSSLFLSMPTLSGQPAAHRWLFLSLSAIALAASTIVPAMYLVGLFGEDVEWSHANFSAALMVGLVWASLGLMMVGIETAGIAFVSRMRGHPIYLAAAAKVTAYSSPLMLLWVLLGAIQLILLLYAWDQKWFRGYSNRTEQIVIAVTLSIAHIGGLLWYELTVYRGIRTVQYANK